MEEIEHSPLALRRRRMTIATDWWRLHWLVYRNNNQISVVIEPGASFIHARLRASLDGLDQGEFTEGHELDRKWRVPKEMIGRRLTQAEAKRVLARLA